MSIRARIHLALGIVLLLHIFTAVMGHAGLQRSQRDFITYESVNADTMRVLAIDKSIAEMQRNVSTYMLSGHASAADRVRELLEEIGESIETSGSLTPQIAVGEQLTRMAARVESFGDGFEKVVADRALRRSLVHEGMFPIKRRLLGVIGEGVGSGSPAAISLQDHIFRAENAALRYFETPDRAAVDEVLEQLAAARRKATDPALEAGEAADLHGMIFEYEQAFLQAVRATRGYMHLVNVVLAGNASELLYQSAEIRSESLAQRRALTESMRAGAKRFQVSSDLVAVLTVLAGLLTAGLMTRSVLRPVLSITATLQRLARGDADEEIQFAARSDEIGSMAKAAEVFRLKNQETEELLAKSRLMAADLERRNIEMTQFVYTVSHDLKSPLVTILGFSGALAKAYDEGRQAEAEDMIGRIRRASTRMSCTVEDLLELSRIGMVAQEFGRVDSHEIYDEVVSDLHALIERTGAEIELVGGDIPIVADAARIRQILQNLVQNAMVHGGCADGVPRVLVEFSRASGAVLISVQDQGPGVDAKYADKVFGLFQRLSNTAEGTGVGLAIVRRIADAHGGRAWLDYSKPGGARFCVSIPQDEGRAAA